MLGIKKTEKQNRKSLNKKKKRNRKQIKSENEFLNVCPSTNRYEINTAEKENRNNRNRFRMIPDILCEGFTSDIK